MNDKTCNDIIKEYCLKYNFIWTNNDNAFWSMPKFMRIGFPIKLLESKVSEDIFRLLHEIGHCETYSNNQTKAQREFNATVWAIRKGNEIGLKLSQTEKNKWQKYIYSFVNENDKNDYKLIW